MLQERPIVPRSLVTTKAALADRIDRAGPAGLLSPRSLLGSPQPPDGTSPGLLQEAAQVLRDPHKRITLRLWSGEAACAETTVFFVQDVAVGGYLLNAATDGLEIAGPVEASSILSLIAPVLPPDSSPQPFILQCDVVAMAALAAVVDIAGDEARRRRVACALDGRAQARSVVADVAPVRRSVLTDFIAAWWGLSRFDQLLTYVVTLGGRPHAPTDAEVAEALVRLTTAGLVTIDAAGRIAPASALEPLLSAGLGWSAGFQWQSATLGEAGSFLLHERIVLLGAGPMLFEVSVTAAGLLRLARTDRAAIVESLVGDLAGQDSVRPPPSAAPEPRAVPPPRFCHQCGKPTRPGDLFCGACGARTMADGDPAGD